MMFVLAHRESAGLDRLESPPNRFGHGFGGLTHGKHQRHGRDQRDEENAAENFGACIPWAVMSPKQSAAAWIKCSPSL